MATTQIGPVNAIYVYTLLAILWVLLPLYKSRSTFILVLFAKFPINSLACSFIYYSCDLCHYYGCCFRSNVSYRTKPHRTCSSSSSGQRYGRVGICLRRRWKHSSFLYYRRDGFEIRHWELTTFVRIQSNQFSRFTFIYLFFLVEFLWWWLSWVHFGSLFLRRARSHLEILFTIRKWPCTIYEQILMVYEPFIGSTLSKNIIRAGYK